MGSAAESPVQIQLPNDRFDVSDGFLKLDYVTITGAVGTSTNSAAVQITGGGVSVCRRWSPCVRLLLCVNCVVRSSHV